MARHKLQAADDLVERLADEKKPVPAIAELIWNALDADATRVDVTLGLNDAGGIEVVTVTDNGDGIAPEACESAFTNVGGSWKKNATKTQTRGRPLHGKSGQGRLRAFALGASVRWTTVARDTAGTVQKTEITSRKSHRDEFDISDPVGTAETTGTTFEGSGGQSPYISRLQNDATRVALTVTFAPYLLQHSDVVVVYAEQVLDPASNIDHDTPVAISCEFDGEEHGASLRIIEWKEGSGRSFHICDADGVPLDEVPITLAPDFSYAGYLLWADAAANRNDHLIPGTLGRAMFDAAKSALKTHFDARREERKQRLIDDWKARGTYPYPDPPATESEALEQAGYASIATAIARHIPAKETAKQKLVLGLLKDSLKHSPDTLTETLEALLGLPPEEVKRLNSLLRQTSLSNVIKAATSVTGRLTFLQALSHIIFDTEARNLVNERDHLHRIIERELWIFGEEYNLMASEAALTTVLDRHLAVLNESPADSGPVLRADGSAGRVDLMLSAAAKEPDRRRHLVVELKRPSVDAGLTQMQQIESYANAVATDTRFANVPVIWDFWLVTAGIKSDAKYKTRQKDKRPGLLSEIDLPDNRDVTVRVWAKTWSEIIEAAEQRLAFMRDELQSSPSLEDARAYLAENHSEFLPPPLAEPDSESA